MEDWDCEENQGKRRDQVETTYRVVFVTVSIIAGLVIANALYLLLN